MRPQGLKFWIAAFVAAVFFLGCSQAGGPDATLEKGEVEYLGRYVEVKVASGITGNDILNRQMGWPGSGLRFRYQGEGSSISVEDDGRGLMDVVVNGDRRVLPLKAGLNEYSIIEPMQAGTYDVQITRRSEFYDTGLFTISGPTFESPAAGEFRLLPAFQTDRKILFLGDSITAGFGVGGDTKDCANTPALHSPTESYAMLTADMFEAEPHLIAISGRGVVHNWDGNPAPVMPAQIDFALPEDPESANWDHSQFMPDVVVTLLGTNDWSVINPGEEKFRKGYRDMLAELRQRFPKAHIVTVGGPLLGGEQGDAIRDGIDGAMADLGDSNISTLDLTLYNGLLKWSCNSHPGRNSMRKMANELSAHISEVKGWSYEPLSMPPIHAVKPPDYMWPDGKAHFNSRLPEIDAQPVLMGGVLLAGDSITEGWLGYDIDLGADVSNHGIGWDTVTGLKNRLPQILRHTPDKLFILIGTNDIGYDHRKVDVMTAELRDILQTLKRENPQTKIYLQSVMPREAETMAAVNAVNTAYQALAAEQGITYIDLTPTFAAPDGTLREEMTYDGLHLNLAGYRAWSKVLKFYIDD